MKFDHSDKICTEDLRRSLDWNLAMSKIGRSIERAINKIDPSIRIDWTVNICTDVESKDYNPLGKIGRFFIYKIEE